MKKRILIGTDSFEKIIDGNYFYIDKTLFIKELLENKGEVTLITRPRRFGKTLNMSMLNHFFDLKTDSSALFDGLKIMEHKDLVEKHLNRYPVIFLTLKSVDMVTFDRSIAKMRRLVASIYRNNLYLCNDDSLDSYTKETFKQYCAEKSTEDELQSALQFLTECLHTYHKKKVIVLIDEYDIPIDNAVMKGFYNEMITFMRGFLGGAFKTNDHLEFGVLTGVQRVSKESLISSFNNPKVCGIMNKTFADCFGFTQEEVKDACEMYGVGEQFNKVESWYNGYRFGGKDMYNPWSVTMFLDENEFKNYWVNTGGLTVLQDIFSKGTDSLKDDMAGLLTGIPVKMKYIEHITYPIHYDNDNIFWSMLLNTGYIKPCAGSLTEDVFYAELVNREVKNTFADCIEYWFKRHKSNTPKKIQKFVDCLLKGDALGVSDALNEELLNDPSFHDFKEENSYHLFIFGILIAVSYDYVVYSNPESGKGRSDCLIKPFDKEKYAVVIEFKHIKDVGAPLVAETLKAEAQKGLKQIEEKAYIHNLKIEGYGRLFQYGIAFHKKNCEVAMISVGDTG